MKQSKFIVLPTILKYLGFLIIAIAVIIAFVQLMSGVSVSEFFQANADIEVIAIYAMLILGSVLVVFSKEKTEDELTNHIRIKAFMTSIVFHSIFFFVFSFTNLTLFLINFPAIILMDSILIVYIIFFYLYKLRFRN